MIEVLSPKEQRSIVRESAPDLYLCNLLLPNEIANVAFILHAFHIELTNITMKAPGTKGAVGGKEYVSLAAEIKLQWWQEVLAGQRNQEAQGHRLAKTLLATKQLEPFISVLGEKASWHKIELGEKIETCESFEIWAGKTRSILFQCLANDKSCANVCGHLGVAWAAIWVLQNFALFAGKNKTFIPTELFQTKEQAIPAMLDYTNHHIKKAEQALDKLQQLQGVFNKKIFLLLQLLVLYEKKLRLKTSNIKSGSTDIWQVKKQWKLYQASKQKRYK